jgi:hypothetical protein
MGKSIAGRLVWTILSAALLQSAAFAAAKDPNKNTKPAESESPNAEPPTQDETKRSAADEAKAKAAERAAARAAGQKALNDQIMAKEFKVEDPKKIDAYVEEQMKKKVKPVEQPPPRWQPGYTCNDLLHFQPVDWVTYRNCRYYYRYYGRYWR